MLKIFREKISDFLRRSLLELPNNFDFKLETPPQSEMGDISLACFDLAKLLKKSPQEISNELANKKPPCIVEKMVSAGPYLNFFIKKDIWFKRVIKKILKDKDEFGKSNIGKKKKILIEYSAPNTNKPLHLGHLRNNFLGMSMSFLFEKIGYKVIKANLINDKGIHIAKSMLAYQRWGKGKTPISEKMKGDYFVGYYYVLFEKKKKKNPELLKEAQELLEKWEKKDKFVMKLWRIMNKWALDGIKETYNRLGTKFDKWYFESDTYNLGKKIIFQALKNGLCYQRPDKAIEIDLTKYGLLNKKVLIRSDGTSVYITEDIGLAKLKYTDFHPDKSIYVVASEQDYHFKVLFKILEIFGFRWYKICQHLSYGMVFLPQGKMKSREGIVVDADNIIDEMENLAKNEILLRNKHLSKKELSYRTKTIAKAALKFFFLKFTPLQSIHFKPKESISFDGATGPYIQYAYARIQNILEKIGKIPSLKTISWNELGNEEEIALLKLISRFPDIVKKSAFDYNPAYLANYLLKLSQTFNRFYQSHSVLHAKNNDLKNARVVLIKSVALVIREGLRLLDIEVLDKM